MLDPLKLTPQTQQLLQKQGARAGQPLEAPELQRMLSEVDTDRDARISPAEAAKVGMPAQDRQLINQALKQGSSQSYFDLRLDLEDAFAQLEKAADRQAPKAAVPQSGAIKISLPKTGQPLDLGAALKTVPKPPAPTRSTTNRLGTDSVFIETNPRLKDSKNPTLDEPKTLDKLDFHGQGNFGLVNIGSDLQLDSNGQAQSSSASMSISATPQLKLGARVDTQKMLVDGKMPDSIDFSGEGSLDRLKYSTGLSYGGQGVSTTRGSLGYKLADQLSVGVQSSQIETGKGMAIKDVGLNTSHQFGALSLGSNLGYDTTTGRPMAGGNLGYKFSDAAQFDFNGSSDGASGKVGFNFRTRF